MFPYQPNQPNNSGQIYADLAMMGSRGLASGISQAGQSIGQDLAALNLWDRQQQQVSQQARGTFAAAQNLVDKGYIDQATLDSLYQLPPQQQIGAAASIIPMLTAAGTMDYHKMLMGYKGAALDAKIGGSSGSYGINPLTGKRVPVATGYFGGSQSDPSEN